MRGSGDQQLVVFLSPRCRLVDKLMARLSELLVINQICLCGFTDEKIKGRRHGNILR